MSVRRNDTGSELFECFLIGNIPDKPVARLRVNDAYSSAFTPAGLGGGQADAVRTAGNDDHLVFKAFLHTVLLLSGVRHGYTFFQSSRLSSKAASTRPVSLSQVR